MAQTGYTPIQLYKSATPAAAPTAGNLLEGELAINTADGKLFYKDSGGSVQTIAWKTTPISAGGTGQTTRQEAMDALAGAVTSGQYLRGNGTDVVMSAIQAADVPTLNQNTTGTAANVTGTVAIANGGTGQTTATAAFNALVPSQTGNSGKYLTTDGTNTSWAAVGGGFAAGTVMLFGQTAAPTGWTKSTTHDNKALRVVSGTAGSGGSAGFTTAFGTPSVSGSLSGTVGATTLSTAQMPSHTHTMANSLLGGGESYGGVGAYYTATVNTGATGGGGSHTHSFSGSLSSATATINVAYVDVIMATKD